MNVCPDGRPQAFVCREQEEAGGPLGWH